MMTAAQPWSGPGRVKPLRRRMRPRRALDGGMRQADLSPGTGRHERIQDKWS